MTDFLQLHFLTVYPPSNLNRDDTGRPKSASFGGVNRLRISSQSLKRAWRQSDVFKNSLNGHLSSRTQRLGSNIYKHLTEKGMEEEAAKETAREIAGHFGKLKGEKDKKNPTFIEQLAFVSPNEQDRAFELADRALSGEKIKPEANDVLLKSDNAADIAMFGRMLAGNTQYNREAAVQVSHAITTHKSIAEDDYYTALDDLKSNNEAEDAGAGFLGVQEFGSGVFYLYICIDASLLLSNLQETESVCTSSISALIEAASTISPGGKQSSFASRAYASYILAEKGSVQPRTLAAAFLKPITGDNLCAKSITALNEFRTNLDNAYGPCAESRCEMNILEGSGSLPEIMRFATT